MKGQESNWLDSSIWPVLDMSEYNFLEWIKNTFSPSYRKEVEAYLAESEDVFDLERRIQILQRRGIV
jgi:hypothetical protein